MDELDNNSLPRLVVGDFNAQHARWNELKSGQAHGGATALADWIDTETLTVHNERGKPTRICKTKEGKDASRPVIDLVLSSHDHLVSSLTQEHAADYARNDHIPFTIHLQPGDAEQQPPPPESRPRIQWDVGRDEDVWQQTLATSMATHISPLQPLLDELDSSAQRPHIATTDAQQELEHTYRLLEAAIMDACSLTVPVKRQNSNRPKVVPWWTAAVDKANKLRRATAKRRLRDPDNSAYEQADRKAQREWRKATKAAQQEARHQLAKLAVDNNSKIRYKALRCHKRSLFAPLTGIQTGAGDIPNSHSHSLDNLCSAYISNSRPSAQAPNHTDMYPPRTTHTAANTQHASDMWTFTVASIEDRVKSRTCRTSAGPDAILPLFLRYGGVPLWTALATVFNYSWRHSVTPQAWREANVTSLFKGGSDRGDPSGYRPISVTSGIARTFEHLINTKLTDCIGTQLASCQFGFRSQHSTSDAILQLLTPLQSICSQHSNGASATGKRKQAGGSGDSMPFRKVRCPALFLDIKKAFDRVDHDILLCRLAGVGVTGAAWRWIRSFLTNRRMRCVDNQGESNWQPVQYGVPQGCVLSPLLFLVFINNLATSILGDTECRLIQPVLYADDGALGPKLSECMDKFAKLNKDARAFEQQYDKGLRRAVSLLNEWCISSRMEFGEGKTKIVIFNRGAAGKEAKQSKQQKARRWAADKLFRDIPLCDYNIGIANNYEYLGLTLSHDFSWRTHIDNKLATARQASSRVTTIATRALTAPPPIITEFVRACVVAAFDYAIEFWGNALTESDINALQSAMVKPLRTAVNLPRTTHTASVLWGHGIPAVATHVQHKQLLMLRRVSRLLYHLPNHPASRLFTALCTHEAHTKRHQQMLSTQLTTPLPVFLLTAVLPFTHPNPSARPLTAAEQDTYLDPANSQQRREWAAGGSRATRSAIRQYAWTTLTAMERQAAQPAAGVPAHDRQTDTARQHIKSVLAATKQLTWKKTHMPSDAQQIQDLSGTQLAHRSTAPIVHCLAAVEPDTQKPLHFLHARHPAHSNRRDLLRRIRLLYGRAQTAAVRHRFTHNPQVEGEPAGADNHRALCPHPQCAANGQTETISHLIIDCPYYNSGNGRQRLIFALCDCGPVPSHIAAILNPPVTDKRSHKYLFRASTRFIKYIYRRRRELGLPDLDTGLRPADPPLLPPLPPPPPSAASSHIPPPLSGASDAPLAAVGAPPSLDTG